jgi:hypothetical protein
VSQCRAMVSPSWRERAGPEVMISVVTGGFLWWMPREHAVAGGYSIKKERAWRGHGESSHARKQGIYTVFFAEDPYGISAGSSSNRFLLKT